jgi:hypothetical protein
MPVSGGLGGGRSCPVSLPSGQGKGPVGFGGWSLHREGPGVEDPFRGSSVSIFALFDALELGLASFDAAEQDLGWASGWLATYVSCTCT